MSNLLLPSQHIRMTDMFVDLEYMYITMLKRIKKGRSSQANDG